MRGYGFIRALLCLSGVALALGTGIAQDKSRDVPRRGATSYTPVTSEEDFNAVFQRMTREKTEIQQRQKFLLEQRYDLSDRPARGVTFSDRPKPIQEGVRARLPGGVRSWEDLAAMTPDEIRRRDIFPAGFLPLPHPNHPEGGMLFPKFHIDKVKQQDRRDLARFDLDHDLPEHFLPAFPPPIYLTTRPDLGDVSQGQLVTIDNFFQLFDGIL